MVVILTLLSLSYFSYNALVFWGVLFLVLMKIAKNRYSLLVSILSFEILVMLTIMLMMQNFTTISGTSVMLFLTLSVCEAVVGLSLIIYSSRFKELELLNLN